MFGLSSCEQASRLPDSNLVQLFFLVILIGSAILIYSHVHIMFVESTKTTFPDFCLGTHILRYPISLYCFFLSQKLLMPTSFFGNSRWLFCLFFMPKIV